MGCSGSGTQGRGPCPGIGGLIIEGCERFHMDLVMLGVVVLAAVGYLLNRLAASVEARLVRWRHA